MGGHRWGHRTVGDGRGTGGGWVLTVVGVVTLLVVLWMVVGCWRSLWGAGHRCAWRRVPCRADSCGWGERGANGVLAVVTRRLARRWACHRACRCCARTRDCRGARGRRRARRACWHRPCHLHGPVSESGKGWGQKGTNGRVLECTLWISRSALLPCLSAVYSPSLCLRLTFSVPGRS